MKIQHRKRKVTTVTLDPEIVKKAKKYNLNISRLSEDTLKEKIRKLESEARPMGAPGMIKKGGVRKVSARTWGPIVVILIVAAALGAWALWPRAPGTPEKHGWVPIAFAAGTGGGIENVYFMDNSKAYNTGENLSGSTSILKHPTYDIGLVMTDNNTFTDTRFPYDTPFDIVVALTLNKTDNVYNTSQDNFKVELAFGNFGPENSLDAYENIFSGGWGDATIRVNVLFDNDFTLAPGASADITVKLWVWK